ncbi:MAG: helix-hairpin-helix domain-containing protein [bacterium]|nr:helix-hairpin-helix domain-containing protein [bacterium]
MLDHRKPELTWTRADLTVMMSLLLIGTVWIAWEATKARVEFTDQPLAETSRVRLATDRIDPNTASQASMLRLNGIGMARAKAIIEYRNLHGPDAFKCLKDLAKIDGIASGIIKQIAPEVSLPK